MGSAPSTLLVPPAAGRPTAAGALVASIADNKGMANIRSFGLCNSPGNPARQPPSPLGVPAPPPPCIPAIPAPWAPGSLTVRTGGAPVLHQACRCQCQWGGVVAIGSPGQQSTTVG